ncbi:MAG TPA: hypothetical protein VHZ55_17860 [Bryobacteraceae bacterium]|jgi:hypothetical protein|nr:hypothetical protein [Bryobacteraceae bacterium]
MRWRVLSAIVLMPYLLSAVIIDRIAIVVGNSIVKDSDISRDIRVTDFLNGQGLDLGEKARKNAANRLIDQVFIRKEIQVGDYPVATPQQADQQLERLINERFKSEAAFQNTLKHYGITAPDLRSQFVWQLTVLSFIDARFKPAVLVTDPEVEKYYHEHTAALQKENPGKSSLDDLRVAITNILAAQRVDKLFFAWLDDQRKDTKFKYFEADLE